MNGDESNKVAIKMLRKTKVTFSNLFSLGYEFKIRTKVSFK